MNFIKTMSAVSLASLLLIGTAYSEQAPLKNLKIGFGFDRGFGISGSVGKLNGFIGNDGASVDYIFSKKALNVDANVPSFWYVGLGGYGDWDGDLAVRLPVGVQVDFSKRVDGYAQIMPRFRFNNNTDFGLDFAAGVRYLF
jgi:hypothetical protein